MLSWHFKHFSSYCPCQWNITTKSGWSKWSFLNYLIIAVDGTPTTGRMHVISDTGKNGTGKDFIIGAAHKFYEPVELFLDKNIDKSLLMTSSELA